MLAVARAVAYVCAESNPNGEGRLGAATPGTVTILFEGRDLSVREGTSVAVALWEKNVRVLSHSPKYGHPRGLYCARGHCTSCLMRIDGVPNVRACETPVRDGLRVQRQDPGAFYGRPLQRVMAAAGQVFPVGFYYKWFTRPAWLSRCFLRLIRPLTGVGRLPDRGASSGPAAGVGEPASDGAAAASLARRDLGLFDCVVVGAGAAGLVAAAHASGRALLVDDHATLGGQRRGALDAVAAALGQDLARLPVLAGAHATLSRAAGLQPRSGLGLALGGVIVGAYEPDLLLLRDQRGLSLLRTRRLVWAAGALDASGGFAGNDRPGLLGPRGLYRAVTRDGLRVEGRRALVTGVGLDLWLAAALLHARGAKVVIAPSEPGWPEELKAAGALGWTVHAGLRVEEATAGGADIELRLGPPGGDARTRVRCELAVICARGKPAYDIPYQLGARLILDESRGGYVPREADRVESRLPGGLLLTVTGEAAGLPPGAVLAAAQR